MVTHTHTQLSFRGWLAAVPNVTAFTLMVILTFSLLGLTSCSSISEPGAAVTQSPQTNDPNDNNPNSDGKTRHTIADWTDDGVFHNTICRVADDSLALNWPNRFQTAEDYEEWLFDDCLSDYVVLNLGVSSADEASARSNFWITDLEDLDLTTTELDQQLYELIEDEVISQKEADFIERHYNIIHLCYGVTPWATIKDSMDCWKTDILGINWEETETTIVPFMSIAYQSFYFWLDEGFDDTVLDYDGSIIMRNDANAAEIDAAAIDYAQLQFGWRFPQDEERILNFAAYCSVYRGWFENDLPDYFD